MNNDLISREALRMAFHERIYYFNKSSWDEANAIIDNAPTVVNENLTTERPQSEWIPVSERLPEERINPNTNDFECVMCSTIWGDIRFYKFGKRIGEDKPHFWFSGEIMDEYVIAWQPLPEPYKKGGAE